MSWPNFMMAMREYVLGEKDEQDGDSTGLLSDEEGGGRRSDSDTESQTDTESQSGESDDAKDDEVSASQSGDDDDELPHSPEAARLQSVSDHWNDDYMRVVPKQLFRQELPRLVAAYKAFKQHLSPQTPHYLLSEKERLGLEQCVVGRTLYIEPAQRAVVSTAAPHTYLVRRDLHYMYTYLVTRALVRVKESDQVRDERRRWMRRQTSAVHFCKAHHNDAYGRVCRQCTVLYTRRSGDLYRLAQEQARKNTQLAPSEALYGRIEPLSYHLVNFLCGPLCDQTELEKLPLQTPTSIPFGPQCESFQVGSDEATDWVALHPVYMDLWLAAHFGFTHSNNNVI